MKLAKTFFNDVRELIVSARKTVARGVDLVQVYTNFEIGRPIFEQEQKGKDSATYGEEVVKALAEKLTKEFGKGFSKRNLELMRRFFQLYADRPLPIAQSVTAQLARERKTQTLSAQMDPKPIGQSLSDQFAIAQSVIVQSGILQTASANSPPDRIRQSVTDLSSSPRPFTLELDALCLPPRHQKFRRAQLLLRD